MAPRKAAAAEAVETKEAGEMTQTTEAAQTTDLTAAPSDPLLLALAHLGRQLETVIGLLECQVQTGARLLETAEFARKVQVTQSVAAAREDIPIATAGGGKAERRRFTATTICKTADAKGLHVRMKGAPYVQFGVPVYEERFADLGIDVDALPFGDKALDEPVEVVIEIERVKSDDPNEPERWAARRVVGLMGAGSGNVPKAAPNDGDYEGANAPLPTRATAPATAPATANGQAGRELIGQPRANYLNNMRLANGIPDEEWAGMCRQFALCAPEGLGSVPVGLYPGRDLFESMKSLITKNSKVKTAAKA